MGLASNVLASIVMFGVFMGGTMSLKMPPFFQAWNYINPMKYAVGICAMLGFQHEKFSCGGLADCPLDTGKKVLEAYNLILNVPHYFAAIIACLVIYRFVATLSIYIKVRYFV